jgi:hypothetical protein
VEKLGSPGPTWWTGPGTALLYISHVDISHSEKVAGKEKMMGKGAPLLYISHVDIQHSEKVAGKEKRMRKGVGVLPKEWEGKAREM